MEIQSLSIAVPAGCPNKCKFCVSNMHDNKYENLVGNMGNILYNEQQYINRMQFARDNGCNTMMFTGSGEPLMNLKFIEKISKYNHQLRTPFLWQEIQTSGVGLSEDKLTFLRDCGINTVSLSLSDMFDDVANAQMNSTPDELMINIKDICHMIKQTGMNLRLSLNMTDTYNDFSIDYIFKYAHNKLLADQMTFRELYVSGDKNIPQNVWIGKHCCSYVKMFEINEYIKKHGIKLELLPFGARRYSVNEMSVVVDEDCMSKDSDQVLKYMILRPNCKLYSRWDNKGSLFF